MQKKQKVITITCSCAEHPCKMHTQDTCIPIRIMYHLELWYVNNWNYVNQTIFFYLIDVCFIT